MNLRASFWFFFPLRVRYAEVDQQGIVFNAHYLTYFDVAITEYFRALGYDYFSQPARTGTDFHVVKSLIEYQAPLRFDEEIEVAVRTARLGRTSLTFALALFGKGEENLRAAGEIVYVNADQATGTSTPIPAGLEALIRNKEH
jgi:acyl-CoA thioester hydrolase